MKRGVAVFGTLVAVATSHASLADGIEPLANDDTQNAAFIGAILSTPLLVDTDLFGLAAYRSGDLDFMVVNVGVKRNLNEHITLAAGYFGLFRGATQARPDPYDHRIRLDGEIRKRFGAVTLQHRQRFEYRFRDVGDGWRWRPEARAIWRTKIVSHEVEPFLALEPFYELRDDRWTVILTQIGLTTPLGQTGILAQPTYIRATVLDGDDLNFFSIFFKYRFQ